MRQIRLNGVALAYLTLFLIPNITSATCEKPIRTQTIARVFQEVKRKTGESYIDTRMINNLVDNLPWFAKIPYNRYIKPKGGASFVIQRCANGAVVTQESAMLKLNTCISKCFFARLLQTFLDWGYADYYPNTL